MKRLGKKGVFDGLENLVIMLGGIAILMAVIFLIVGEVQTWVQDEIVDPLSYTNHSVYNDTYIALNEVEGAMMDIPTWLAIVVITIIGGLLLTLVRVFRKK